jgi:hypothetical protein
VALMTVLVLTTVSGVPYVIDQAMMRPAHAATQSPATNAPGTGAATADGSAK